MKFKLLPKKFYNRDPALVAVQLLGKLLIRRIDKKILAGMIVETEAYYGKEDPASRAYKGKNKISELMFDEPGRALIYMVHANWLLNATCLPKGQPGAVLIRALEPIYGIKEMMKNRNTNSLLNLTNGPGKLTKALSIDKSLHGSYFYKKSSFLQIAYFRDIEKEEIGFSKRIGVSKDLEIPLRFFIKQNKFVSK
ncbi:MAG: hypothetical protein B6U78_00005 [Candidatus Aenigmarchaeota archaeon ex4484_224]|nr:MAG: hypothetical protein B6U78_00005 [Candidatus Aenigmarchaeota archaeon ex4484_224]